MISPLKKKHLHLKNGMRWDSLLFKNVSRATKKLAFTKQLIKIFLWIVQEGTPDRTGCVILIRISFFHFCFIRGWALLIFSLFISCKWVFLQSLGWTLPPVFLLLLFSLLSELFCLKIDLFPLFFLVLSSLKKKLINLF